MRRASTAMLLLAVTAGALTVCGEAVASPSAAATPSSASAPRTASAVPASGHQAGSSTLHMIKNHGHRLAFHVTSGHLPAIVLDAGGGNDSSYWKDLVPKLSAATGSEIITYDRAGMGDSDPVPGPWNVHAATDDLAAGLHQLGLNRDVILASHSEAGEIATYFARSHPTMVSGAVLIDASLPELYTDSEIARIVAATQPALAAAEADPSTQANRQLIATAESYVPMHKAYHHVTWPDSVPATVMVSEKTPFDGSPQDAQLWRDAATEFAHAGPHRTLVTAAGSSHDIPIDRPGLVLGEIEKMAATRG
ncbi:alpha/beta fold hydrolase [Streptomyces sp. NBC_01497]|uniref:alpha/beta fold hydrolase n=1 Tax=Streptomyces sp. NBC_01497 TaxID=2903885 RepID=UPI002E2FED12|nr:alpha/beta hydrolase [Streptomyces sp. NBC_01497]